MERDELQQQQQQHLSRQEPLNDRITSSRPLMSRRPDQSNKVYLTAAGPIELLVLLALR